MSNRITNIQQLIENQNKLTPKNEINKFGGNIELLDKDYKIETEEEKEELSKKIKQNSDINLALLDRQARFKINLLAQFK